MPRSPDFRYLFVNAFTMQMTNNEMTLRLGMSEDVSKPDDSILEQVGIVLTPNAAKLLSVMLAETLSNFEKTSGTNLELDQSKLAHIQQQAQPKTRSTQEK